MRLEKTILEIQHTKIKVLGQGIRLPVVEKFVTTTIPVGAQTVQSVEDSIFVPAAEAQIRCQGVLNARHPHLITATSNLNRAAWARLLAYHPDREFSDLILKYIEKGVPIMYNVPEFERTCDNWNSTLKYKTRVFDTICADVVLALTSLLP